MTSLNPAFRVGRQIAEVLQRHLDLSRRAADRRAVELLELVRIPAPERRVREYPHQLSGGMRQRVMIAMALACDPKVLVADEPTTALDVTIQAGILDLMRDIRERLGTAIVLITHNLGVVADIADRVLVMYAGRKVEEAPVARPVRATRSTRTRSACSARFRGRAPRDRRRPAARDPGPRAVARRPVAGVRVRRPLPARRRAHAFGGAAAARGGAATTSSRASIPGPEMSRTRRRPTLEVENLVKHFQVGLAAARRRRDRPRRRRRLVRDRAGRDARARRRVGQRQVDGRELRRAAARADGGDDPAQGPRHHARCRGASCGRCGARCTSSSRIRTRRSTRG